MKMKKCLLLSLVLALVLALVSLPVFATGTGTITIENATVGKTYNAYKIFDASYGDGVTSYTIDESNLWFGLVNVASSPFTLERIGTGSVHNVSIDPEADVIGWLSAQVRPKATYSVEAVSSMLEFTQVEPAYYLIDSALESVVTITHANPSVTIIDKNQRPALDKVVAESEADATWSKSISARIGDTAYFKIDAFAPKYNGDQEVYEYVISDTLATGFQFNGDSFVLKINGVEKIRNSHYGVAFNMQVLTVYLYVYDITDYATDSQVEISYSAQVGPDAVYDNVNTVAMTWTEFEPGSNPQDILNPAISPPPGDIPPAVDTHTYVCGFTLQKYKNSVAEDNKMDGAEFRLYDALGKEIPLVLTSTDLDTGVNKYRPAIGDEIGTSIKAGSAAIFGLNRGTYLLEETKAPAGYNQLTECEKIVITETNVGADGYLAVPIAVINTSGVILPETGGIGTTIFYSLGSALILIAAALFFARKRNNRKKAEQRAK